MRVCQRFFPLYLLVSYSLSPTTLVLGQSAFGAEPLAHTFSIVARDQQTGEMGVAVQSHWFSVGTVVSWGEAGVGVVATQSFVNKSFGPRGLAMLKSGMPAAVVLDSLLSDDPGREVRQVAILDAQGNVASFTGENCIQYACNTEGDQFSVQSNMMLGPEVCNSMQRAYESSVGKPLAERLLLALEGAQAAGGDYRGQQSAAVLVVAPKSEGKPWDERLVDLRVDDSPQPIAELRRLYTVHTAYEYMNKGDYYMEVQEMDKARAAYSQAMALLPDRAELQFWTAVGLANAGRMEEAMPMFQRIFEKERVWQTTLPRIVKVGLLTVDTADLDRLMKL